MSLRNLLQPFTAVDTLAEIDIKALSLHSQEVVPGTLFVALNRGIEFIPEAIAQGAVAVLVDAKTVLTEKFSVPIIPIVDLSKIYGDIADRFYGEPSKNLKIIAVTGTNGKTSVSYYVAELLQVLGQRCGIIGTLGVGELGQLDPTGLTTPDAISVHRSLKNFLDQGLSYVAMEVSSHALAQHRVQGVRFSIGIFTNLTHDHLDYHGTMDNYFLAKRKLFEDFQLEYAVINADDPYGQRLLAADSKRLSYSLEDSTADVYLHDLEFSEQGFSGELLSSWGQGNLIAPLLGAFNASNVLASLTAVACLNAEFSTILNAVPQLEAVPGRMQCFHATDKPLVIVDYAHTPDALSKALLATRQHTQGQLYCVFGCGGSRDTRKRAEMAAVAEALADVVWVTNDNPREEDPQKIISDILAGFQKLTPSVEPDRATAIAAAISAATAGDVVLVAGKGHEDYQIIGKEKFHFSDAEQVAQAFQ